MKKSLNILLAFLLMLTMTACGGSTETGGEKEPEAPPEPLTESEIKQMYSDADPFKGRSVELVGQIFSSPEYDDDGVYFQIYADPTNYEMNTLVAYGDPSAELASNDYVRLTGIVEKTVEYENMLGGTLTAPLIYATELEKLSYIDAVAPTLYTATAETATLEQYGYAVTIKKAELAGTQTRLYVTVTNNGSSNFSLYEFNAKLAQNGKQYETEWDFNYDYPELQTDLMPGVSTEGIILFPAIENAPFQVIMEGYSENWDEDIEDYIFDLTPQ